MCNCISFTVCVRFRKGNEVIDNFMFSGFLANVFQGVVYDRVATIQLVLSTFLEKVRCGIKLGAAPLAEWLRPLSFCTLIRSIISSLLGSALLGSHVRQAQVLLCLARVTCETSQVLLCWWLGGDLLFFPQK